MPHHGDVIEDLSARLKAARRAHGHSQSQAAHALKVSVDAVRDWENGRRTRPYGPIRRRLERYLAAAA